MIRVMIVLISLVVVLGCPETEQILDPVISVEPKELAEMKQPEESQEEPAEEEGPVEEPMEEEQEEPPEEPEEVPEEPETISLLTSEVGFFSDWQLTTPATGTVRPGDTIYTEIVFSHPVHHVVADDASARPEILLIIDSRETRYRVTKAGAHGADFQSGDCKPRGDTTYLCKYTITEDDIGSFALRISATNFTGTTITTIRTAPFTIITPLNPQDEDFVGRVETIQVTSDAQTKPGINFHLIPVSEAMITIVSGSRAGEQVITDIAGHYRFPNVAEDQLHLHIERDGYEPNSVVVHRHHATTLPDGTTLRYHESFEKEPGTVYIGHVWPDEVRPILEQVEVEPGLLYITDHIDGVWSGNYIPYGVVYKNYDPILGAHDRQGMLAVVAHEIFHAHQSTIALGQSGWERSPEGVAYIAAREKDLAAVGPTPFDTHIYFKSHTETAAEIFAHYWGSKLGSWEGINWAGLGDPEWNNGGMEAYAPNRLAWAEEWFPVQ